jgi:hypothetical protein
MDPFAEYLKKRWEEGCHNGAQLYREIHRQGYKGSATALRRHLRKWRGVVPEVIRKLHRLPDFPTPSPRQVSWWLFLDEDRLEKQEREYVQALTRLDLKINQVQQLTKDFRQLVKQRQEPPLDQWQEKVERSGINELKSFAAERADASAEGGDRLRLLPLVAGVVSPSSHWCSHRPPGWPASCNPCSTASLSCPAPGSRSMGSRRSPAVAHRDSRTPCAGSPSSRSIRTPR